MSPSASFLPRWGRGTTKWWRGPASDTVRGSAPSTACGGPPPPMGEDFK